MQTNWSAGPMRRALDSRRPDHSGGHSQRTQIDYER
jgi:hypothetical protein